jgi:putative membrane protein
MSYLLQHWAFSPFLVIAIALAVWHEIGLARLARRSPPDQTVQRRKRSLWFYGGLAVLLIAVQSPINYWSYDYFFMHMFQHLLLMFAAPTLVVAGAPWQPLRAALPRSAVRGAAAAGVPGWSRPLRGVGGFLMRPWVAIALFNFAMVFWHIPAPFDLAERNLAVHTWLMESSFILVGVLFWLQFIPSPPLLSRMSYAAQAAALVLTNVIMWVLAMSMSIFTQTSWYSVYQHIPGITLSPFADQQIGAAILWVCGDFWAIPALIYVVRRMINEDGSVSSAVDRILGRGGSARYRWAGRS